MDQFIAVVSVINSAPEKPAASPNPAGIVLAGLATIVWNVDP